MLSLAAVYWNRNILLRKIRAPSLPVRFDEPLWRYVGYVAVVWLITVIFSVTVGLVVYGVIVLVGGLNEVVPVLIIAAATVAGIAVGSRISLVLPAAAVGNREIGIQRSWQITRGNTWRLIGLVLMLLVGATITGVLIGLPLGFLGGVIRGVSGVSSEGFILAAQLVSGWIMIVISLAAISLVYAYLVRGESPDTTV
jgi:hypothetical protein